MVVRVPISDNKFELFLGQPCTHTYSQQMSCRNTPRKANKTAID